MALALLMGMCGSCSVFPVLCGGKEWELPSGSSKTWISIELRE